MIHAFGEIRRACGLPGTDVRRHRDGARDRGRLAQYRESAFARQFVERGLHHGADMEVDRVDVGVLAELAPRRRSARAHG